MSGPGRRAVLAAAAMAPLAAPSVLRAEPRRSWRMVTSWPRDFPGPGMNARRLAERIGALSGGRLTVDLYAAGEIVPGLQVLDAVAAGAAELGHTAALYWTSKTRAAAFFTTVPFGMTPAEHHAWIEHGGGQALWDELYAPFGLKPFMAGSSGMQMGGWFERPIDGLQDLAGLRIRAVGLSADVFQKLGAAAVSLPAGEILPALQNGAIDAVEFLGPASDRAAGLHEVAKTYLGPSFTKPNGTAECIVRREAYDGLPPDLRVVLAEACRAENEVTLAESDWRAAEALEDLTSRRGVAVGTWPAEIVRAARRAASEVLAEIAEAGEREAAIVGAYERALARLRPWSEISVRSYLGARALA